MRTHLSALLAASLAACSASTVTDASAPDATGGKDASALDATQSADTGFAADSGVTADSGVSADGSNIPDSGPPDACTVTWTGATSGSSNCQAVATFSNTTHQTLLGITAGMPTVPNVSVELAGSPSATTYRDNTSTISSDLTTMDGTHYGVDSATVSVSSATVRDRMGVNTVRYNVHGTANAKLKYRQGPGGHDNVTVHAEF